MSAHRPLRSALSLTALRHSVTAFGLLTLGEWIFGTAVAIAAFVDGGALAVGLVGARFLPAAAASLLLGHHAERVGAGRALAVIAGGRAATTAAAALTLALGGPLALVMVLVWLDAVIGSGYRPAQSRLLPSLVRTPLELTAAVTLTSSAKSIGQILGALAGGLVIAGSDAATAVALAAACSIMSAGLALIAAAPASPAAAIVEPGFARGLRRVAGSRETLGIAIWSCARSLLRGLWMALGVIAAVTLLGMGESGFGVLMAAAGVGTVLGITASTLLAGRRRLAAPFAVSLALAAASIASIGLLASAPAAIAAMVAWGVGMALADVNAQALLARVVPPAETAPAVGAVEGTKLLAEGLGALLAPVAYQLAGLRASLVGCGALLLVLLLADLPGFRAVDRRARGRMKLLELAREVPLFPRLRVDGLEAIVAAMVRRPVTAGEVVFTQDTPGSTWYLVEHGQFAVEVDGYRTGTVRRGRSFGERGLLRAEPRAATISALGAGSVLELERADFLRAVTGSADAATAELHAPPRSLRAALARQHALTGVPGIVLRDLEEAADVVEVPPGTVLFSQGEDDDRYLVLLAGRVEVLIDGEVRRTLRSGDALGEIAVMHATARTATARTIADTTVAAIPGELVREALADTAPA